MTMIEKVYSLRTHVFDNMGEYTTKKKAICEARKNIDCEYVEYEEVDSETGECLYSEFVWQRYKDLTEYFAEKNLIAWTDEELEKAKEEGKILITGKSLDIYYFTDNYDDAIDLIYEWEEEDRKNGVYEENDYYYNDQYYMEANNND